MSRTPRRMDRRRFVQLVAATGAAVIAAPLTKLAAAPASATARAKGHDARAATAATSKEIRNQERSMADALKVIRGHELPPGSPMAFAFAPIKARRRRGL